MKVKLLNLDNTKSDTIEISDKILKNKINYKLIKSVVDWQLNHLKPRTAKTKQRNQIKGSTKKIIAQKNTKSVIESNKSAYFPHDLFEYATGAGISGALRRQPGRGFGQRGREGGKLFHQLARADATAK